MICSLRMQLDLLGTCISIEDTTRETMTRQRFVCCLACAHRCIHFWGGTSAAVLCLLCPPRSTVIHCLSFCDPMCCEKLNQVGHIDGPSCIMTSFLFITVTGHQEQRDRATNHTPVSTSHHHKPHSFLVFLCLLFFKGASLSLTLLFISFLHSFILPSLHSGMCSFCLLFHQGYKSEIIRAHWCCSEL